MSHSRDALSSTAAAGCMAPSMKVNAEYNWQASVSVSSATFKGSVVTRGQWLPYWTVQGVLGWHCPAVTALGTAAGLWSLAELILLQCTFRWAWSLVRACSVSQQVWGGAWASASRTSSQVMLPILEPHLEYQITGPGVASRVMNTDLQIIMWNKNL